MWSDIKLNESYKMQSTSFLSLQWSHKTTITQWLHQCQHHKSRLRALKRKGSQELKCIIWLLQMHATQPAGRPEDPTYPLQLCETSQTRSSDMATQALKRNLQILSRSFVVFIRRLHRLANSTGPSISSAAPFKVRHLLLISCELSDILNRCTHSRLSQARARETCHQIFSVGFRGWVGWYQR